MRLRHEHVTRAAWGCACCAQHGGLVVHGWTMWRWKAPTAEFVDTVTPRDTRSLSLSLLRARVSASETANGHMSETAKGHVSETAKGHVSETAKGHVSETAKGHVSETAKGHVSQCRVSVVSDRSDRQRADTDGRGERGKGAGEAVVDCVLSQTWTWPGSRAECHRWQCSSRQCPELRWAC